VSLEAGKERLLEAGGVPVVKEKLVVIHPSIHPLPFFHLPPKFLDPDSLRMSPIHSSLCNFAPLRYNMLYPMLRLHRPCAFRLGHRSVSLLKAGRWGMPGWAERVLSCCHLAVAVTAPASHLDTWHLQIVTGVLS
jgi:hypothetical protein